MSAVTATKPRVFLHVGAPKTGTSFLQDVLWNNREALREAGVLYPGLSPDAQFHAAMDLQATAFQEHQHSAVPGAWERLVGQARAWRRDVVISHELFSMADERLAARALDALAWADVHIVCTVRDLARQLPAVWQEDVKNRQVLSFAEFARELAEPGPDPHYLVSLFWRLQDIPRVLDVWAARLPADRIRLVTVPKPGSPPDELWARFGEAIDLDPGRADIDLSGESNRSMGIAETNLLRRLNLELGDSIDWPTYDVLVKDFLALSVMGKRQGTVPLALPACDQEWVARRGEQMVDTLRATPYRVIGDLDELRSAPTPETRRHPDDADDGELADSAVRALAGLLRYVGENTPPRPQQAAWRRQAVRISQRNAALGQLRRQYLAAKARRGNGGATHAAG
jgi:hypothetical protein